MTESTSRPYGFAIIGCGNIAPRHADAIAQTPRARLMGVLDVDPERARALAAQHGVRPFVSLEEMLADSTIDVIDICTPSGTHADIAFAALNRGFHVLVEKPLALEAGDAARVLAAHRATGKALVVVMQHRLNAAIRQVIDRRSQLGSLLYISTKMFWYRPQSYYDDGSRGTPNHDGGVFANQGIHFLDMLLYLVGRRVVSVSAFGGTFSHRMQCEDVITVNLRFEHGLLGNLEANTISYPEDLEGSVTLWFEKATVKVGGTALNQIDVWNGVGAETIIAPRVEAREPRVRGHQRVIESFVNYLDGSVPLFVDPEECVHAVEVMAAVNRSMASGQTVAV